MSSLSHLLIEGAPGILDFARLLLDFNLDPTQATLLTTTAPYVLLNCHRQWGKTTLTALRALHQAITISGQTIVVLSPTLRQSRLLLNRCREFARRLQQDFTTDGTNPRSLLFPNGSLILALPAHADHARGFSAHLLIIDEAARVSDEVYSAITPLLAATHGHLWLLSTPRGKRGFFYREAYNLHDSAHPWLRLTASAADSQRLSPEFLAAEQSRKTEDEFSEEYQCGFTAAESHVFTEDLIQRSLSADIPPFVETRHEAFPYSHFYVGVDFGKKRDHSVITLVEYRTIPTHTRDPYSFQWLFRRELHLRYVERFPLHTPFLTVLARLARLAEHPALKHHGSLAVDATGLGEPLVELIREQRYPLHFVPINITGGQHSAVTAYGRNVPKADLVNRLQLLLERGHLLLSAHAPQLDLLRQEMLQLERTVQPSGRDTFDTVSSRAHDDAVMSLSLAAWWAWENRKSLLSGVKHKPLSL